MVLLLIFVDEEAREAENDENYDNDQEYADEISLDRHGAPPGQLFASLCESSDLKRVIAAGSIPKGALIHRQIEVEVSIFFDHRYTVVVCPACELVALYRARRIEIGEFTRDLRLIAKFILLICVDRQFQGSGIGSALCRHRQGFSGRGVADVASLRAMVHYFDSERDADLLAGVVDELDLSRRLVDAQLVLVQ